MKWRRPQERLLHPGRRLLFSDAEPRENLVDDVFADGLASDFAELFPGGAQVDGDEVGGEATAYGFESGAQMVVVTVDFLDGADIEDPTERLNAAVEAEFDPESATLRTAVSGGSLGDMGEFLRDSSRKEGDVSVVESAAGDGYYVVVFLAREDNHYPTASVRHILIKAEADEEGNYTDEAKAAAKARAEEILAEFEAGDKTEESFAALAEQYSEDEGSNTNGGLYENIYKGQMVQEFNDFCFGGHKSGDTAIVYGESGSYAGYHVVYYVGDGGLYSDYIAKTDLQSKAMSDWTNELNEACTVTEGFGFRFVGK